jgi:predicted acyl esterase
MTENDVPITTRDGTVLRTNVYRPTGAGPFPVLLCAHPYGKDNLPEKKRGRGYSVSQQSACCGNRPVSGFPASPVGRHRIRRGGPHTA